LCVEPVDIFFSDNNGIDWEQVAGSADNTEQYSWTLPIADSNQCLILVEPNIYDSNATITDSGLFTIRPDTPGPTVDNWWKSLGGDFDRKGLSEGWGPELGCIKWQFETSGPVSASVTVGYDGRIHIPCEDGNLYTVDANGVLLWSYEVNSPILSSPTIRDDGSVYVGTSEGMFYAIDIDGNLRWTYNAGGMVYSSAAVSKDGKVYLGTTNGVLHALGEDGSELWAFETGGHGSAETGAIFSSATIDTNGVVYVGSVYDSSLYALDGNDGTIEWVCQFDSGGWPFASAVLAEGNSILYQTLINDPNLYAIDSNDGHIIWEVNLSNKDSNMFEHYYVEETAEGNETHYIISDSSYSEPVIGDDGTIYVSFDDPHLRAVEPNGVIKWVTRLGMLGGFTLSNGSDGLVYAASDDMQVYVVNPEGEEIARFEGQDWLSFPVITEEHTLIVSDSNNVVWAIGGEDCEGEVLALHRPSDLDSDGNINFIDYAFMANDWLDCTDRDEYTGGDTPCGYTGELFYLSTDINRDFYVDSDDIARLANEWLME
jgi:outer membrane protein assembly factor BamB